MVPGSVNSATGLPRTGRITLTTGTPSFTARAAASRSWCRRTRGKVPAPTSPMTPINMTTPNQVTGRRRPLKPTARGIAVRTAGSRIMSISSSSFRADPTGPRRLHGPCFLLERRLPPEQAVDDGYDEERGDGSDGQAADHRSAEGRVLLPSLSEAEGHGKHADDHGERGHEHGAQPRVAGRERRRHRAMSFPALVVGEGDEENAVRRRHTDAHDRAHERGDADARLREKQRPENARDRAGQGREDDERIEPRLEVDHHEGVDEHDREDKSGAQPHEGRVHALDLAPDNEGAPPGQRARGIG